MPGHREVLHAESLDGLLLPLIPPHVDYDIDAHGLKSFVPIAFGLTSAKKVGRYFTEIGQARCILADPHRMLGRGWSFSA